MEASEATETAAERERQADRRRTEQEREINLRHEAMIDANRREAVIDWCIE